MGVYYKFAVLIVLIVLLVFYFLYYYFLFPRIILYKLKKKFSKEGKQWDVHNTKSEDLYPMLFQMGSMGVISNLKPDDYGIIQMKDESSFSMTNINKIELNLKNDIKMSPIHDSNKLFNFIRNSFMNDINADYLFRSKDLIVIKKINKTNAYLYLKYMSTFSKL